MRSILFGLAILASPAFAQTIPADIGVVSMTWAGCTGPVDETTSVGVCFRLSYASYLNLEGIEVPFNAPHAYQANSVVATFNGPSARAAVPARATTWGSIKSQYRN